MRPHRVTEVAQALTRGEWVDSEQREVAEAVRLLCDALASRKSPPDVTQARKAVAVLNEMRHFDASRALGQAWLDTQGFEPTILRRQAQALIELSALDAAESLLGDGIARAKASADAQCRRELVEYEGLRGRIEKQRFVTSGDDNRLVAATDLYSAQYHANGVPWHGINVVALRMLEERRGLGGRPGRAARELAEEIYQDSLHRHGAGESDQWTLATASEACLALKRCDDAELWLYRFLHHPETRPFHVESYARQVREIWGGSALRNASCADRLTGIIERHVARTQHRWSVTPRMVQELRRDSAPLEKNFSSSEAFSVETVKRMLQACSSIGCVSDATGRRLGTGFLVAGDFFSPAFGHEPVFVTNAHVVSPTVAGALRPDKAFVSFEIESAAAGKPVSHKALGELLFTSEPGDIGVACPDGGNLDVTLLRLATWPAPCDALPATASVPTPHPRSKAYVVGHPQSGALQISLQDSEILDVCDDERLMHYRTPTDPGSSGSPVFNMDWQVVALHHAGAHDTPRLHGEGRYEANEGITLQAIRARIARP